MNEAFSCDAKSVRVSEDASGDLIIEGLASDFDVDRDGEAFAPGAFERGLKAFLRNPVLLFHHRPDQQIGLVTEARVEPAGLRIKAIIPAPPAGSWATHAYTLIKRGMLRGLSVGGHFERVGSKIVAVDLNEISITPLPVNPRTLFAMQEVADVKAQLAEAKDEQRSRARAAEVARLRATVRELSDGVEAAKREAYWAAHRKATMGLGETSAALHEVPTSLEAETSELAAQWL